MDTRLDFIILAAGNPDTRLDKVQYVEYNFLDWYYVKWDT